MRQQSRAEVKATKKIKRTWTVAPALAANGTPCLVYVRLGNDEYYMPHGMAVALSNALADAIETGETTNWKQSKTGRVLDV